MKTCYTLSTLALALTLPFSACGDDAPANTTDTVADTVDVTDTAQPDSTIDDDTTATTVPDATTDDDTSETDAAEGDTGGDDTADTSGCEYLDDPRIIACGNTFHQYSYWSDWGDTSCPTYWTRGAERWDSYEALVDDEGCQADCLYIARTAVDFISCGGNRNGYEVFQTEGASCEHAEVYRTSDGILTDLCQWGQYACHCEEE